jgi:hypothetical protein
MIFETKLTPCITHHAGIGITLYLEAHVIFEIYIVLLP